MTQIDYMKITVIEALESLEDEETIQFVYTVIMDAVNSPAKEQEQDS